MSWKQAFAFLWAALAAVAVVAAGAPPARPAGEDLLWHHRNLGKAFYENPTTQAEAVEQFKKALELAPDSPRERLNYGLALLRAGKTAEGIAELERVQKQAPEIPHTWFSLGITFKKESHYDKAIQQLERMIALVPDEPVSHYNLGVLYKLTGKPPEVSLRHFETAAKLGPRLAGPRFQLYNAYRQAGRQEEASRELEVFRELKKLQEDAAIPEDLEWSWYSEIYEEAEPRKPSVAATPEPKLVPTVLAEGMDTATSGLALLDADGDNRADLLAWSAAGARLFRSGEKEIDSGLAQLQGVVWMAPGDFDNDGRADLAVIDKTGASLYKNGGGTFRREAVDLPKGRFARAVWLDFDHDYDVDLLLLGEDARLVRNQSGAWSDETSRFPFAKGKVLDAVVFDLVADGQGQDLAVVYADRPGVIYRDRLGGLYEAVDLPALPAGTKTVVAADFNQDGWTDLLAGSESLAVLLNERKIQGGLGAPAPAGAVSPPILVDFGNRGLPELIGADLPGAPFSTAAMADFDNDGRVDLAAVGKDGTLRRLSNRTENSNRFLTVALEGVKNLKLAPGAEVEVKAGSLYQKRIYQGVPLVFGLGSREQADTVRITWPNGLIQNEIRQPAGKLVVYKEAPRLSGSCPMVFTWNGERFQFITDVLGVAPLGASAGDGEYFPVDHDEDIQIPAEALVEVDGRYEVRMTEELREVAYLDQIRLLAVDHPEASEIFTNDKFKGPPFPEFRLFGVERKIRPARAIDHNGRDVRERLLAKDATYPDGFRRDYSGVAELHSLTLDFGKAAPAPENRVILVLSGWVDWADGSTFLGAAQAPDGGLVMPRLEVKDENGQWRTAIEDMGIPAGKPKTIVVDLTGKLPPGSRELRIVTNLCVYWDEIFLSEEAAEPEARISEAPIAMAGLRFRGFSRPVIHPERKQPESFDYQSWMPVSMWNPTPGLYTRYGDVRPLLSEVDDRLVIMGSGDEIRLSFDATALPPLPAGWRRDFLLRVDGWAKDGDANTAHSQTVEPLPFHGMSRYPYPEGESFPDGETHRLYREHYNTRPALRILRPLTDEVPRP